MSADRDAGKLLITPKGEYNGSTTYEVLDAVYYITSTVKGVYVAKTTTTGNLPTDTTKWQLLIDLSTFVTDAEVATASTAGLVKPDGITDEVNALGILTALGVVIKAEIDSTATAYGAAWLKVGSATLTPSAKQMYRVTESGHEYLYYWNGTNYAKTATEHIIVNAAGTEFPQRSKLKVTGASVVDDAQNDQTILNFSGGGGGGSTIKVTTSESTLQGKNVTISDGTTTLTETFNNLGVAIFDGVTFTGNLTISSSDGVESVTRTLSVPYFGNYETSLAFWAATIDVTASSSALNGQTVYAKKNGIVKGYATIVNGAASITVPEAGTYSIEATLQWMTYTTSIVVSAETTYSATLTTFSATINLTTPTAEFRGQSIAVTVDGTSVTGTAFDNNGEATYTALKAGTYVFTLTYNGETYTATQVVSAETTYSVQIKMWTATIVCSTSSAALIGQTLTVMKGGVTVGTTTFDSNGDATFAVHEAGTYTLEAVDSGWTYSTVVVVSAETTYTATLNTFNATLSFSTSAAELQSATVTIKKSGSTIGTVNLTNGSGSYVVHETGTYTYEHTYQSQVYSGSVAVSSETTYSIVLALSSIYGAEWDGTSTTAWSRTDDAAGFTDPVPYVSGASSYGSPFDNLMPWSGMVKEERTGGTMVKIPKFWYKITQNGAGMKVQISDGEQDGLSVSPAHMDRGDGKGERDYIYVGRYHCGSTAFKSATGQTPKNQTTRSDFRTSIHNLGTDIWQLDFATRFTIWMLYIVEFADWNSQAKIGYGCGDNSAVQAMGYTDSMPYHTGTTQSSRTTYGLGTQYRYIEGLWDNVYDWIDGCYNSSSGLNIILNPANFSDSSGGISVGTPSSGYPSAFTVANVSGTFPTFIPSAANGSDSTYSCDYWSFNASSPCLYGGGYYSRSLNHGLFYVSRSSTSYAYASLGSRLMELP